MADLDVQPDHLSPSAPWAPVDDDVVDPTRSSPSAAVDESHLAPEDRSTWPPPSASERTAPFLPPPTTPAAPTVARWPAWLIAVSPMLVAAAYLAPLFLDPTGTTVAADAVLIAVGVAITAFCAWDAWRIHRAERGNLIVWAILLTPVYLFLRQRRLGQTLIPAFAYLGAFGVYVACLLVPPQTLFGVPLDMPRIETGITQNVSEVTGIPTTSLTTDCPTLAWYHVGDTFDCTVTDGTGDHATVRVTVLTSDGDVNFRGVAS
jgi:hypothetical protein